MRQLACILTAFLLSFILTGQALGSQPVCTDFADFTLNTADAPAFQGEKADGQPLFLFYSSTDGNVAMTAVNAVWSNRTEPFERDEFTAICRQAENGIRDQYESDGSTLKQYDVSDAVFRDCWGIQALVCDTDLLVRINETDVVLGQRRICVTGDFGTYLFSLSAWSADLLEQGTEDLIRAVQWKNPQGEMKEQGIE